MLSKCNTRHRKHCLVLTDTDLFDFTRGKTYPAIQRWRRSICLRDPCYDVGCYPCLKIWSKNQILESIKGRNSVANFRKTTIYNANIDLVNNDVYTKFGLFLSLSSQDIE